MPNGYPGKRTPEGVIPHPIYGTYVISDYLAQYLKTGDEAFLGAIHRVSDAAREQMTEVDGGLLFFYPPGISGYDTSFASGLTQSRYMDVFSRVYERTKDDKFKELAQAVFRSHLVAVAKGGPLLRWKGHTVIEEYPFRVPTFVQNGWTTSLHLISEYADRAGDDLARDLFNESLKSLISFLPLYDARAVASSRYELTRPVLLRLTRQGNADLTIAGGHVDIAGEHFAIDPSPADARSRFHNRPLTGSAEAGGAIIKNPAQINLLLSRVSYPELNIVHLKIDASADCSVILEVGHGDFSASVFSGNHKVEWWDHLTRVNLKAGRNAVIIAVPWDKIPLVGHPTNFGKRIGEQNFNVYHFIHIDNLLKLNKISPHPELAYWAKQWEGYVKEWPEHRIYSKIDASFARISDDREALRG